MSIACVYFNTPDQDAGPTADEIIMKATVCFNGTDVPGGPITGRGANDAGVPVGPINLATITNALFSNAVEDAAIAEATRLGIPAPARTRVFFQQWTRGA